MIKSANEVNYPIQIFFLRDAEPEARGYYVAFLPDFGFAACSATGDSPAEAVTRLQEVKASVIRHYVKSGLKLPKPTSVSEIIDPIDTRTETLNALLLWAKERYESEVAHRPDVNIYKKVLETTWNQVIHHIENLLVPKE